MSGRGVGGGGGQKGNGVEGGMHNMKHYLEHEEQRVYTILFSKNKLTAALSPTPTENEILMYNISLTHSCL